MVRFVQVGEIRYMLNRMTNGSRNGSNEVHVIKNAESARGTIAPLFPNFARERLFVVSLDENLRVLSWKMAAEGTSNHIPRVTPRMAFQDVMASGGKYVIMAHSHPPGTAQPSPDDVQTTKNLAKIARTLEVEILDHMIFTDNDAFSMRRAENMMPDLKDIARPTMALLKKNQYGEIVW